MNKKIASLLAIASLATVVSCTENSRAKSFGGTMTIDIPQGNKLISATWKEDQLWYLYRPARAGETPETSTLKEDSKYGLVQGKVIFVEK